MNYTKELISIFTQENIEKIKIIIFSIKELYSSNKKGLIPKLNRIRLLEIYDNCKKIEQQNTNTENEIRNFFEYYYVSVIKDLERTRR